MKEENYEKRKFQGVWIPREIWLTKELKINEKVFLTEIKYLSDNLGCFASNSYFAKLFGLSTTTVSRVISNLTNKGFVSVKLHYFPAEKRVSKRVISVNYKKIKKLPECHEKEHFDRMGCPIVSIQFKGIWINKTIWDNKNINLTNKIVLAQIDSFSKAMGCFASNKTLGGIMGIKTNTLMKIISKLKEDGYIFTEFNFKVNTKYIQSRLIKINWKRIKKEAITREKQEKINS